MKLLLTAHVLTARTKFIVDVTLPYPHKQIGVTYSGNLHLESVDGDEYQLKLYDGKVEVATDGRQWRGFLSLLGKSTASTDSVITIHFSDRELRSKEKIFSFYTVEDEFFMIEYFDMKTFTGCWFRFDTIEEAVSFAKLLRIDSRLVYNTNNVIYRTEAL